MMNGGILALCLLFLLTLSSQGSWCAADSSASISADHHLQVREIHGKKNLAIQSPGKHAGHGQSLTKHEVSAEETNHHRRITLGHKGGSVGGGGGGTVIRPHSNKNGAAALAVPVASVLALSLACFGA